MSLPGTGTAKGSPFSILQRPVGWALRHWLALAISSWVVCGALYLTLPPSPDQFQHAYMGWRLLEGDVPYRDFIDMNWPGVMALHALAAWIFGINLWSWRALDFALFAASAFFLADLARRAAGQDAGKLSLILCPLIYAGAGYWLPGQHDTSAAQFLVAALWFHVRGYEQKTWWVQIGTGLCIGAAMLNKPTVGIVGVLLPLHALWFRTPFRRVLAHTTTAGTASLATLLAALGAILARGASWVEIVDGIYTYNITTQYSGPQTLPDMVLWLLQFHYQSIPAATLGSLPAVFWIFAGPIRSMTVTALPVLWLAGVLSFLIQWRGLDYHLAPCLVALIGCLAISVALVASGSVAPANNAWKRTIAAGVVAFSLAGIGIKLAASYHTLMPAILGGDYSSHLARFGAGDEVTVADTAGFARRLEALPPADCVLLVGNASSINYLSRRRMPTRFYYHHVLKYVRPPLPLAERWLSLWEEDLRSADCRLALVSDSVAAQWLPESNRAAGALRRFLDGYRKSGMIGGGGGITVYERK